MKTPIASMIAAALLIPGALACSTGPTVDDDAVPTEPPGQEAALERPFAPQVPPMRDHAFVDGDVEVSEVEEFEGVYAFRVGEVEVIHMPTPVNEVVAARLYLRGGSANLDEDLQGIDRLSMAVAVNGGTELTSRDEFNARLDAVGSSVSFLSERDFSGYSLRSVREHFDETWTLFEEAILAPAFPADEVEIQRDRQLASIRSIVDNPDRLVNEVARDLTFADHPYLFRQLGQIDSVSQFTAEQLRAWQRNLLVPERMLLVVVGNLDHDHLVAKIASQLGRLAPSGETVPELPELSHEASALRVETLDLPTNYILGYFSAPGLGHRDYPAMVLATQHLRDRLFEEVRTRRNLTYAVSSGVGNRGTNVGFLYVTAVDPAETMPVIFDEVEKLKTELVDQADLDMVRNVWLTRHYQDLETNASIAGSLARAQLLGGDWRLSQHFSEAIIEVTPEDLQRVATDYMENFQFGVVGDPQATPPELFGVGAEEAETVDEIDQGDVIPDETAPDA